MKFIVNPGNKAKVYKTSELKSVLVNLSHAKKNITWIRKDLSTSSSSWFTRLIWNVVAKRFSWMRKGFYKVDLEKSKKILDQLSPQIALKEDSTLTDIFNKAVKNFNKIAPGHKVQTIESGDKDFQSAPKHQKEKFGPTLDSEPSLFPSSFTKFGSSVSKSLIDQLKPYNHGKLHFGSAKTLVEDSSHKPGTYLIRQSWDSDYLVATVLSDQNICEHIRFKFVGNKFQNEDGIQFKTLQELVVKRNYNLLYPIRAGSKHPASSNSLKETSSTNKFSFDDEPKKKSKMTGSVEELYKKELEEGKDVDKLLKKAHTEKQPAIAAWLVKRGASIEELKKITSSTDPIISWLDTLFTPVEPTPKNLDHFALTLGYGYKSANLLVMEKQANEMSKDLKSATVKVPAFLPVGNFEMFQCIQKEIPQVFTLWNDFKNTFDLQAKKEFLEAKTDEKASQSGMKITPKGEKILNQIVDTIIDYFRKNPYFTLQMQEWLKKEKPQFLIVRSTGKEDSDTNSNAGGNASIPFVEPEMEAISEAIGEVIASYFGEKSINQRILCGDRSLITDEKPFIPILLQKMIGENIEGKGSKKEEIPRSGVLFTCQSDKAEGVSFIQTGLGNNEGVVTSQVGVDSYYVKDNKVHAVVRRKETRFVSTPDAAGKMMVLPIKNNHPQLENSQALPTNVILDIKTVADTISKSYAKEDGQEKPMDMEYTVKLKEKGSEKPVIYLLQARPLLSTEGDEKIKPSYLDLPALKKIPEKNKVTTEVLLDGNAYVRNITDPAALIFADDLPSGEYDYSHAKDPASIKAIIIKKTAPATSHEAVILRPKGVAVLVVDNPEEFASLSKMAAKASKDSSLLLDTQRGIAALCQSKHTQSMIKEGLVSYPIPLEVSIPPSKLLSLNLNGLSEANKDSVTKSQLKAFNKAADLLINHLLAGKQPLKDSKVEITDLFDLMATGDASHAKHALGTLLSMMRARLKLSMKKTEAVRASINRPMFQAFEAALKVSFDEILPALKAFKPQSLERLYPIKFLHAMLFQKYNPNIISGISYKQTLSEDKTQQEALKVGKKNGVVFDGAHVSFLIELQQLLGLGFNEKCKENWQAFIKDLAKLKESVAGGFIQRLKPIINQTNTLNILSIWINCEFNTAWVINKGNVSAVIKSLEKSLKENESALNWVKNKTTSISIYEQAAEQWTDPQFAKKNAQKMQEDFQNNLGFNKKEGNSIASVYKDASSLGKLALLQYIRRAVNSYDCLIKAVKKSDKFSTDKEKAIQVADMLEGYFKMMQACFQLIAVEDQEKLQNVNMGTPVLFNDYIARLRDGLKYAFGFSNVYQSTGFSNLVTKLKSGTVEAAEQLEARNHFSVDSLVIGSKADLNFSVHWPDRLEEYFTTFHQNMEQVVKFLNTKCGLNQNLLMKPARDLCDAMQERFGENLSYLIEEDGKLRAGYQIPLRQHSANLMVDYAPQNPEKGIDLTVQMFGNDEHNRWDQGAAFGAIFAYLFGQGYANQCPPKIYYENPKSVEFSVHLPSNFSKIKELVEALYFITKTNTMGGRGSPKTFLYALENGTFGFLDWNKLNPNAFKYSLHINATLIESLLQKGQKTVAAEVAIHSFLGLAHYKMNDYLKKGSPLLKTAMNCLEATVSTSSAALEKDFNALLLSPEFKARFGKEHSKLTFLLNKTKKPEEAFEELFKAKSFLEAFLLAIDSNKPALLNTFAKWVEKKIKAGKSDLLLDLVIQMSAQKYENQAKMWILEKGLYDILNAQQKQKLQVLERKSLLTNLASNVAALKDCVGNFELEENKKVMQLAADSLIGLSQCADYQTKSFGQFFSLNHLGKAAYNYIYDNNYPDTTKLRKAAPLYIIQGFESKNVDVKKSAVDAFRKLSLDYALFGRYEAAKEGINHVMFALARAYLDNSQNLKDGAKELFEIFQNQKEILIELASSDKIPLGITRQALCEAVNK